MYFYLSANTAKDMGITDFASTSGDHDEFSRHWYLHRVILERRKIFIAMEAHTRYAMIFCGVTKPVLAKFPILFADYLWRHIVSLCAVDDADFGHIRSMAASMCAENVYYKGLNKSVQAHIKDAAHQLEYDLYRYGFPDDPGKEFFLSMNVNKMLRTRHGEKRYIVPLEEFQRLWCEILGVPAAKE